MNLAGKYRKSLDEKWSLRFKTRHPDGDKYDGVVTQIKSDFIALREEEDFDFDGMIILPKKSVTGYRDGKYDRCCNEILRDLGVIKRCRSPRWLDGCDTLIEVIKELKRREVWPGVEIIFNRASETAFYIGPITRTEEDCFYLRCYDAAGKWEKEYELRYGEIFKIEFDSNYCNRFNSYMRRQNGS